MNSGLRIADIDVETRHALKGPYERLKYDLRRLWECPQCHKRERTEGSVTFCLCSCAVKSGGRPIPMKLLEEAGHRTVPPIVPRIDEQLPEPAMTPTAPEPTVSQSPPEPEQPPGGAPVP